MRDQVDHLALLPKKWVNGRAAGDDVGSKIHITRTRYLTALIHKKGKAVWTAKSAQVLHFSLTPQKCVRFGAIAEDEEVRVRISARVGVCSRVQGPSNDFAAVVYRYCHALIAAERAQVDDLPVFPQDGQRSRSAHKGVDRIIFGYSSDQPAVGDPIRPARPSAVQARRLWTHRRILWEGSQICLDASLPPEDVHCVTVLSVAVGIEWIWSGCIANCGHCPGVVQSVSPGEHRVAFFIPATLRTAAGAQIHDVIAVVFGHGRSLALLGERYEWERQRGAQAAD